MIQKNIVCKPSHETQRRNFVIKSSMIGWLSFPPIRHKSEVVI